MNLFSMIMRSPVLLAATILGTLAGLAGCERPPETRRSLPVVRYIVVEAEDIELTRELSGRTSAYIVSGVRPQVSGIIQKRLFTEGADVHAGDVLYQIDPSHYEAVHNRAKAALMEAEAEAVAIRLLKKRYERLVTQSAVSRQEHDNAVADLGRAEARVAAAKAALDTATIDLEYTRVTAPVSGRIGRSAVTPGALVTQNQADPLAVVQQLDPMYVDVTQSSVDLLRLKHALGSGELRSGKNQARLTLILENGQVYREREEQALPGDPPPERDSQGTVIHKASPIIGRLAFSDVSVDQDMGVVGLRAIFPNPDGLLLPGMYVRVVLQEGIKEKAVLVPQKSVLRNSRGEPLVQVLVPADSDTERDLFTVESRVLTIDRAIGNKWLVTSGLEPGALLMVEGLMKARPGQSAKGVRAQNEPTGPAAAL